MQVHSRLDLMMQSTIGLPRLSSSLPLRMQCAQRQSRGLFMGYNVGLKVGERGGQMILGFEELIAKKTMEQPTKMKIKIINTLTLYNKVLPTTKGNELNLLFIYCFFSSLCFSCFFLLLFVYLFCYFCFFIENKKHQKA